MARGNGSPPPAPPPAVAQGFAVFVDSSIGTHLALLVSPDDTVAHLKRKIKVEHALCFPDIGEVNVHALKVKRRGSFYRLSDSMLVKNTFDGIKGTRFLYADAEPMCLEKQKAGNIIQRDGGLLKFGEDRTQDVCLNVSTGEKSQILTDTGSTKENATLIDTLQHGSLLPNIAKGRSGSRQIATNENLVPVVTCLEHVSSEPKSIHHEFEMSPSEAERSEPGVHGMPKQASDLMVTDHGEKAHIARKEECKDLVAKNNKGIASTVTVKKAKGEKRSNVMQDDLLLESNFKHPPVEKKKHKKGKSNSSSEPVGYSLTGINSGTTLHATKTMNLENSRLATMLHEKHTKLPDSAEGSSCKRPNGESLPQQVQCNDGKKPGKKKRQRKSVVEIESPLRATAHDITPALEMEESYSQDGRHKDLLNRSSDVASLDKGDAKKNRGKASDSDGINSGKNYVLADTVEEASRKVSDDVHPEETSGNNGEDLTNDSTMVEQMVEPQNLAKVDTEDRTEVNVGSSHRRKRKKSGKSDMFDHHSGIDDRSSDLMNEDNPRNLSEDHHRPSSKECEGTTVLGEVAGHTRVDSEIPPRLNEMKPRRRRKKSAITEFHNHESIESELASPLGKEIAEEDPKKTSENNHMDMGKDSKSVDPGKALAVKSSSILHSVMPPDNSDKRQHHLASDQDTRKDLKERLVDHIHDPGKESESAVVVGEAGAFESTLLDFAVPTKRDDKKSRRSWKKSAKTEVPSYDYNKSGKKETEEKRGKSLDNLTDLHKESKRASSPRKGSSFESLTKVDGVISSNGNSTSHQAYEKDSKETLMEHPTHANKKGSLVLNEATVHGNPAEVSSVVLTELNEKKPRRSRKKSAKTELPNHEFVQPESVQSLSNGETEGKTIKTMENANVEFEKELKPETVAGAAASLESPAEVDLVVPSGSVHADHQVTESYKGTSGGHQRKGVKRSKELGILGEASGPENPAITDFAVPPQPADKRPRRSRKKSDKTQLPNNESMTSESILPLGKEKAEENLKGTLENDKVDLGTESKSATVFGETADVESLMERDDRRSDHQKTNLAKMDSYSHLSSDLVDISGNKTVEGNVGKALETKFENSSDKPSGVILFAETAKNVEDCGKEAKQDFKTPPEYSEANCMDHSKLDTDKVNFIDFFIPKVGHHENGYASELTSETENRKLHYDKTKREQKSNVLEQNCSQGSVNPSSSNQQSMLNKMPQDVDAAVHGLDNSPKQLPGKGQETSKAPTGTTVERKSDSGVFNVPVTQNTSIAHSNVNPKEVRDDWVESDDSSKEDTPLQSKRYRIAVRKVPSSRMAEVLKNSKQKKTMLATSSTIFGDATSESTHDEQENSNRKASTGSTSDTSSASSGSDSEVEQPQKMTNGMNSSGIESDVSRKNNKEFFGRGNGLTQSSASRKGMPLSAILKGTSSYKKAKRTASQSQPDDSESQPIDVVLETQPDSSP